MTRDHPIDTNDVVWERFRKRAKDLQARSESIRRVSPEGKKRIFKVRAQVLRQEKGKAVADCELVHLISFYVAGEFFGIEVKHLQEVYETTQITKIPCTPDVLLGLMNYRGAVLTIIDLSLLLDLRRSFSEGERLKTQSKMERQCVASGKVLIVEHAGRKAGLLIQKLDHLLELSRDLVRPVSSFFQNKTQIVKWEAKIGDRPLLIIDPEEMMNDTRLSVNEDVQMKI